MVSFMIIPSAFKFSCSQRNPLFSLSIASSLHPAIFAKDAKSTPSFVT